MGYFTIDYCQLDVACPKCGFFNSFCFRQARLRDVIICRGCKVNIQLDDQMNECKKAERSTRLAMDEFLDSLGSIEIKIEL